MKKYVGNMKTFPVSTSPNIWTVGLGKFPSSPLYISRGNLKDSELLHPCINGNMLEYEEYVENMKKY